LRVESRHNARLREVARLVASSRDRRKSGRCVLEGVHLIDVYCSRFGSPETLVVLDEALARQDVADLVAGIPTSRTLVVSRARFADLAALPPDVATLAVVPTPAPARTSVGDFCLLLEDVQDPGNVGTMIRTAAAAGVDQVLLSRQCAFAWSPKALRAGQGAHFLTTVIEAVDLMEWVRAFRTGAGRAFATVVSDAPPLYAADLRGRIAIVIGSEGSGVSSALLDAVDGRISIPMASGSESLNAAAAAAVVLFEAVRQRLSEGPRSPIDRRHRIVSQPSVRRR
jgi:TrmH family RNA methyltransferase